MYQSMVASQTNGIVLLFLLLGPSSSSISDAFTSISSTTPKSLFRIHSHHNHNYHHSVNRIESFRHSYTYSPSNIHSNKQSSSCRQKELPTLFYRSRIRDDGGHHDFGKNRNLLHKIATPATHLGINKQRSRVQQYPYANVDTRRESLTRANCESKNTNPSIKLFYSTNAASDASVGRCSNYAIGDYCHLRFSTASTAASTTNAAIAARRGTGNSRSRKNARLHSSALYATSSEELKSNNAKRKGRSKRKKKKTTTKPKKSTRKNISKTATTASAATTATTKKRRNKSLLKRQHHAQDKSEKHSDNNTDDDDNTTAPSFGGIERLSRAVAKASAERETLSDGTNNWSGVNDNKSMSKIESSQSPLPASPFSSGNLNQPSHDNENVDETVSSLTQLTQVIDSQLYANGPRGTTRGEFPHLNGVVQNARDNMISLLGFNQVKGDWKQHSSQSTYNVAVVFGKDLVRDQITVEYASRIRTLARLFKEEPDFRPSLVCFCGGIADGNHVSNADAGYIFFRHMCEAQGIDLDGVGIFIDNASRDDEDTIYCATEKVKSDYVPLWLESSPTKNSLNQKVVAVHFTMISTEYHLCNINDVHHRSPQQSLFTAMEDMGDYFKGTHLNRPNNLMSKKMKGENTLDAYKDTFQSSSSFTNYNNFQDDNQDFFNNYGLHSSNSRRLTQKSAVGGVVNTSWSFQYATYPYIYAKDEATVFLGKCYLLGEELMPLLMNMKGVVDQEEFFQRDNYLMLTSIRRSLVNHIEDIHKPSPSIKTALIRSQNLDGNKKYDDGENIISILEGALLSLGRCVDLVKPAGLHIGSVSKTEWKRALHSLEHSMSQIRDHCDPDRPLRPSEWGKLVDDEQGGLQI